MRFGIYQQNILDLLPDCIINQMKTRLVKIELNLSKLDISLYMGVLIKKPEMYLQQMGELYLGNRYKSPSLQTEYDLSNN